MPDFVSSTGGGTGVGAAASAKGHELKRDQESLPLLFIEFLALEGASRSSEFEPSSAPSSFSFTPIGNLPIGRMGVRQCSTTLVTPPQQKQQGSSESGGAESAARPLLWEVALVNGQHHLTLRSAIAIENNMGVDIEAAVMDASRAAAVWHRRIPVACCPRYRYRCCTPIACCCGRHRTRSGVFAFVAVAGKGAAVADAPRTSTALAPGRAAMVATATTTVTAGVKRVF